MGKAGGIIYRVFSHPCGVMGEHILHCTRMAGDFLSNPVPRHPNEDLPVPCPGPHSEQLKDWLQYDDFRLCMFYLFYFKVKIVLAARI